MLDVHGTTILSRLIEAIAPHTDRIHVVVGYREEMVIDHVASHHRGVVLVRNPDFRTTNTITSLRLGARGLDGQVLFVDGDTVVRPASLSAFIQAGAQHPVLVGTAPAQSEDGVFVTVEADGEPQVRAFHRDNPSPFEWANILLAPREVLATGSGYVFEVLEPLLPLPRATLELAEVDTEQDLARARDVVAAWDGASQ